MKDAKPFLLSPEEVEQICLAYDSALAIARNEGRLFARPPTPDLRQRLACLILLAAREGIRNVDQLTIRALRALRPIEVVHPTKALAQ